MARTLHTIAFLFTIAFALIACTSAPPKPAVDYDAAEDFSEVKTIGFYALSGSISGDNPMQLTDFQKDRINEGLGRALETKGFTLVDSAKDADLLISWHLNTIEKQDIRTTSSPNYSMGVGYSRYNRYAMYNCYNCMNNTEVRVSEYTQGTFIIDMISPEKKRSVWRSVTQSKLKGENLKDQASIDAAAARVLADFPPGAITVTPQ